jgi:hypothetical protein
VKTARFSRARQRRRLRVTANIKWRTRVRSSRRLTIEPASRVASCAVPTLVRPGARDPPTVGAAIPLLLCPWQGTVRAPPDGAQERRGDPGRRIECRATCIHDASQQRPPPADNTTSSGRPPDFKGSTCRRRRSSFHAPEQRSTSRVYDSAPRFACSIQLSMKLLSCLLRDGCRSFRSAFASICRMRSRVTSKSWPTSSRV